MKVFKLVFVLSLVFSFNLVNTASAEGDPCTESIDVGRSEDGDKKPATIPVPDTPVESGDSQ